MRWIYLSPHLDDAVFSAGGLIYEQVQGGIPVEIWTLMCGFAPEQSVSSYAASLHEMWGAASAEEATRMRREEDRRAATRLRAEFLHFDFLDCIYRHGENGEWLYSDVFSPPHPGDADLPARIAAAIRRHLKPDDLLVCQLSVGSHVDHVLVRQGAEQLGLPLLYTIDLPYIFYHPEEMGQKSVGMKESENPVTETGLNAWKEAAVEYRSQLSSLGDAFDSPEKAQASIQSYWAERSGIRILQNC